VRVPLRPRAGTRCRYYPRAVELMTTYYRDRHKTDHTTSLPKEKVPPPKVAKQTPRSGRAEPWAYGPYRVVAQRRVSEEEQLSVECYAPTVEEARSVLRSILFDFRAHMIEYNEKVVLVQQEQLRKIETMIEERGAEARRIEEHIHALVARRHELEHPDQGDAG